VDPGADAEQGLAERSVAAMYGNDQASQAVGIRVDEVAPGRVRVSMDVTGPMVNGHGIAHGGYVFLLADSAFAFACNSHGEAAVARTCDIEFLAPARAGDRLVAEAVERARRGRSGIYDVSVRREADGELLAEFRGHSRVVQRP
jgi:acyl-CoA thioesterase